MSGDQNWDYSCYKMSPVRKVERVRLEPKRRKPKRRGQIDRTDYSRGPRIQYGIDDPDADMQK